MVAFGTLHTEANVIHAESLFEEFEVTLDDL